MQNWALLARDCLRQLVAYELAAAVGEDGGPIDQARPALLAAAGGESSDAVALSKRGAADRRAAGVSGVGEVVAANK